MKNLKVFYFTGGLQSKSGYLKFLELNEAEELKQICIDEACFNHIGQYMILTGLLTGCRYSEVTDLTWKNINLKTKRISIEKSWDYIKNSGFKPTKTDSSVRTISINNGLIQMFQKLRQE
ncbi:site-specific integrase [Lactobacillus sp. W8089]|nr:site-specific integrase [Lactobacillus sp. W8086]MBI0109081.1 site-specific integrase [Lactobacillus sp. W8085]MBI0112534.1 site-specific integrase [Lactobacillus sp. W8088]MBI0116013.1 site-specific integrase [Lactobacillus sp. W8087]MBI0119975.1 site-specific integrase [Lactobacillus sp. W8089]MBI0131940.1 site-specific integrase [Lactobacillus sp. W8090]